MCTASLDVLTLYGSIEEDETGKQATQYVPMNFSKSGKDMQRIQFKGSSQA